MKSVFNSLRAIRAMLLGTKLDGGFRHCKKQSIYALLMWVGEAQIRYKEGTEYDKDR